MTTATPQQQQRLRELHKDPDAWVGYWCSDQWGRSANGGSTDAPWHAEPGKVQQIDDDLMLAVCPTRQNEGGLHATRHPHQWQGSRVWIVALIGEKIIDHDKCAARKREIICEVRPDDVMCPQIAARLALTDLPMRHADLRYADLRYADLRYADLRYANLLNANLPNGFDPPESAIT